MATYTFLKSDKIKSDSYFAGDLGGERSWLRLGDLLRAGDFDRDREGDLRGDLERDFDLDPERDLDLDLDRDLDLDLDLGRDLDSLTLQKNQLKCLLPSGQSRAQ